MSQENIDKQQEGDKISKRFDQMFAQTVALFKGTKAFKKVKASASDADALVEELLEERKEEFAKEFKTKAKSLLEAKMEFDRTVAAAEKDLKDKVTAKKKEFIQKMEDLFKMIENIKEIEQSFNKSFKEYTEESVVADEVTLENQGEKSEGTTEEKA